jgi:hypothetical protein
MGYYHIKLDADSQSLCTIVFSWRKIQKQTLTYGYQDCLDPDGFPNLMSTLVQDMEHANTIKSSG